MDASFGFVGKDYALIACDCSVPRSIVLMKSYEDKILEIGTSTLFALSGDVGDRYVKPFEMILEPFWCLQ